MVGLQSRRLRLPAASLLAVLICLLAACRQPLYSELNEQEANDVIAALAQRGIDASKAHKGDKGWGVDVAGSDFALAVEASNAAGVPKQRFSNLGDLFKRSGIVSTPTEERVRFMHGISQELAQTLMTIDGVLAARVHLVMPQNDPLADKIKISSASVLIKHRPDVDLQPMLPAIKSLVLRSVEGLSFDTVYVSMFVAQRAPGASMGISPLSGLAGVSRSIGAAGALTWALLFCAVTMGVYFVLRSRRSLMKRIHMLISRDAGHASPKRVSGSASDRPRGTGGSRAPTPGVDGRRAA